MKVQVQVINAFSIDGTGGNPAGVVFDADNLSASQKQEVAAKVGLPETAFVSASKIADFKLDFFTPIKQIPHCGHATIATFSFLKKKGGIKTDQSSKETIDGTRSIYFKNELAFMEQRSPVFNVPEKDQTEILNSLGIQFSDLIPGMIPTIVNTGNSFLIVPVKDEAILSKVVYDKSAVTEISEKYGLIGFYLFTFPPDKNIDATTRMFAPFYGIDEEAGTGMAAGPLASYLFYTSIHNKSNYIIEQGKYMQSPSTSRIYVNVETNGKQISKLFAGGNSFVAREMFVEVL
ncbi:MAG: PhzF family phenazine biosynthesis protein [Ferruginibacter sp.]